MPTTPSRRTHRLLAGAAALAGIAAACTGGDNAVPTTTGTVAATTVVPRSADGVLTIGLMAPLTGSGATIGVPIRDAIVDVVDQINEMGGVLGNEIELIVEDEEVSRLDDLVAQDIDALIGPMSSLVAISQLDAALQPGHAVVTCSPTATALSLDDFPDRERYFFRTVPSDSMQMEAIAVQAQLTGENTVAIAHLDDLYGRGLATSLVDQLEANNRLAVATQVAFSGNEDDLGPAADEVLADGPGVVVVLGDADDGGRFLSALDAASAGNPPSAIIVNDTIRTARQVIQQFDPEFRDRFFAVAPDAGGTLDGQPLAPFVAHAIDCLHLIALAAEQAESDAPSDIRPNMKELPGAVCRTFDGCVKRLRDGLQIDYSGLSGPVDLSGVSGQVLSGRFELIQFNNDGTEMEPTPFSVG